MKIFLKYSKGRREQSLGQMEGDIEVVGDVKELEGNVDNTEQVIISENNRLLEYFNKLKRGVIGRAKSALGVGIASKEVILERLSICHDCEFRKNDNCGHCGCPLKHKTRLEKEACPVGFWKESNMGTEELGG